MTNSTQTPLARIQAAVDYIRSQTDFVPKMGLILGSGLGFLSQEVDAVARFPFSDIPNFPQATVSGHAGELVLGTISSLPVALLSGRAHLYEGYSAEQVVFPARVLRLLGADSLLVTNAAGGLNPALRAGDLMMIRDHINGSGVNPLVGPNIAELGPRFPDMTYTYTPALQTLAKEVAAEHDIPLKEGVYYMVMGPSYETPSEVRLFHKNGGDAVGMSTVPEIIAARHMGMDILAISCISNAAAGLEDVELSHDDVKDAVQNAKDGFARLVRFILARLAE
jgi:purine-nucleoside phosphorylase